MPKLHSISGLFDDPNDIIHAAEAVVKEGYTKFDVHTPYPLHGMDAAMALKPSKLGFFTLAYALTGTTIAVTGIGWIVTKEYPMIIGGKPFFSLPSYVPIMFELTVLLGAVLTVLTLIFAFLKLPLNSDPTHETPYMKAVADDRFGILIEADDPKFDENTARSLFEKLGAKDINPIYFPEFKKEKLFNPAFTGFLVTVSLMVGIGIYTLLNIIVFLPPFNWLTIHYKVSPQTASTFFADGYAMREPVTGTVSRGNLPYPYAGKPEMAAVNLSNPLLPTEETLLVGKEKFNINCSVCHGYYGEGDSRLRGQYPNPPSLHSSKVRDWSDGSLFHVITEGQNIMPAYGTRLNEKERWAVVLYLRALQRSFSPTDADVEKANNMTSELPVKDTKLAMNNDKKENT